MVLGAYGIKAADRFQNFKTQSPETFLFRREFIWLYGPWKSAYRIFSIKAPMKIIGGKGAISNITNYNY